MALTTKRMEFENSESMERFLMLYKDLFKPWSEDTIKTMDYIPDRKYVKDHDDGHRSIWTKGHHDDGIAKTCREGYLIVNDNTVRIHIEPADFKQIETNFKKVKIRPNMYKYVLEG